LAFEGKTLALVLEQGQLFGVLGDLLSEFGESFEGGLHLFSGLFGVSAEGELVG
jgi:hypothetical protein